MLSFAPKDRYPSAEALAKALGKVGRPHRTMRIGFVVALLAAVFLLAPYRRGLERQGVVAGIVTRWTDRAVFRSELIEQAVRLQLGKDGNEPVYRSELAQIERLSICGDQVYDGSQELLLKYHPGFTNVELCLDSYENEAEPVTAGTIDSLEDISMLTGLKRLDVIMQNVGDLSPLSGLPIEELNLAGNSVEDLSPLAGLSG